MTTNETSITRDLERYYEILRHGRQSLLNRFSTAQISAILESLNGVLLAGPDIDSVLIRQIVEDGLNHGLAEKWQIGDPTLIANMIWELENLSVAESCALADAAERWWNRVANGEQPDVTEALL